ncbi:MAG: hypothetical protein IPK72_16225 [Candidatus Eisenbacteria bacterium]|nr:hypothetical protein [Candidatus Eisenbacteria bacterium]
MAQASQRTVVPLWEYARANFEVSAPVAIFTVVANENYVALDSQAFHRVSCVVYSGLQVSAATGDTLTFLSSSYGFGGYSGSGSPVVEFEVGQAYYVTLGYCSRTAMMMVSSCMTVALVESGQALFPFYGTSVAASALIDSVDAWKQRSQPSQLASAADVVLRGTIISASVQGAMNAFVARGSFVIAPDVVYRQPTGEAIALHVPVTVTFPGTADASTRDYFTRPHVRPNREVVVFARREASGVLSLVRRNTALWEVDGGVARVIASLPSCGGEPSAVLSVGIPAFEAYVQ